MSSTRHCMRLVQDGDKGFVNITDLPEGNYSVRVYDYISAAAAYEHLLVLQILPFSSSSSMDNVSAYINSSSYTYTNSSTYMYIYSVHTSSKAVHSMKNCYCFGSVSNG